MFSCSFMQPSSSDTGVAAMTTVIKFLPPRDAQKTSVKLFRRERCHPPSSRGRGTTAWLKRKDLFRGEGGDNFFEARIAAEWVPPGKQLQTTVAECAGKLRGLCQLLQGKIFFTNPGRNDSGELDEVRTIERVFRHRQQLHRALCLL